MVKRQKVKKGGGFRSLIDNMIRNTEGEPIEYFGYGRERQPDESPFELSAEGLVCVVSNIVEKNQQPLIQESGIYFALGQWIVSQYNEFHEVTVYGPFDDKLAALDYGREQLGVVSYHSFPVFDVF
ncbi:hypothetical protein L4D76_00950 [Photobacterium sagamiensis]|uniref:hypothetical protein n=1 Tax=Photobacterium sagamiensis TaxID=2910241 RepID=UPI003D1450BE